MRAIWLFAFLVVVLPSCVADENAAENITSAGEALDIAGLRTRPTIAVGAQHTCVLNNKGRVYCWGSNASNELGTTNISYSTSLPSVVNKVDNAIAVVAGTSHTCALIADGTVRCWGSNVQGQLGLGTTSTKELASNPVSGLTGVVALAAGSMHTCAVDVFGAVKCWGANDTGQLGDGTTTARPSPTSTGITTAVDVVAGDGFGCALLFDGSARCWGDNLQGQLGIGTTSSGSRSPVPVTGLSNIVQLSAGSHHACALRPNGSVACWGDNRSRQLALNDPYSSSSSNPTPTDIIWPGGRVKTVAAGGKQVCVVLGSGALSCWGDNSAGQLGDGTTDQRGYGTPLPTSQLFPYIVAAATRAHTCAMGTTGMVYCWGANASGQTGVYSTGANVLSPVTVTVLNGALLRAESTTSISAGAYHSCGTSSGFVKCWGGNGFGQLGDGTTTQSVGATYGTSVASHVASGLYHTCSMDGLGGVWCWGYNAFGQVGDGTTLNSYKSPRSVGLDGMAVQVVAGAHHSCALLDTGTVQCWGYNAYGQVGDGSTTSRSKPVAVSITDVVSLSAGYYHTCALKRDGDVRCWGYNTYGQLGNDSTANSASPVSVHNLFQPVSIVSGGYHTCTLSFDGSVDCWGLNGDGQLGAAVGPSSAHATWVKAITGGVALAAGGAHTCAALADGTARCWGGNWAGQLGNDTTQSTVAPVTVTGLDNVIALGAGDAHTCARRADGTAWCWGANGNGQLGDGSTLGRKTPVQVLNFP